MLGVDIAPAVVQRAWASARTVASCAALHVALQMLLFCADIAVYSACHSWFAAYAVLHSGPVVAMVRV